jgi:hypothetical protein
MMDSFLKVLKKLNFLLNVMGKRFREGVGGGWNVSFTNGVAA